MRKIPIWIGVVVAIGATLMATGSVIAIVKPTMLVGPSASMNQAALVYAGYFIVRNFALAAGLLVAWWKRAAIPLRTMLFVAGTVQFMDAVFDAVDGRWPIFPGVLVLAVLFMVAATKLGAQSE